MRVAGTALQLVPYPAHECHASSSIRSPRAWQLAQDSHCQNRPAHSSLSPHIAPPPMLPGVSIVRVCIKDQIDETRNDCGGVSILNINARPFPHEWERRQRVHPSIGGFRLRRINTRTATQQDCHPLDPLISLLQGRAES